MELGDIKNLGKTRDLNEFFRPQSDQLSADISQKLTTEISKICFFAILGEFRNFVVQNAILLQNVTTIIMFF